MNKEQKVVAIDEITGYLQSATAVYLTDFQGLSVAQTSRLRNDFREAGIEFKVVKNTLLRRAMEGLGGYDEVFDYLHGATGIALTNDPAAPAKILKKFIAGNDSKPKFKGAYVGGAVFTEKQLETLTTLKSKDELVGEIIGLLLAPASNIVGALQAQGSNILGILKAIEEKGN